MSLRKPLAQSTTFRSHQEIDHEHSRHWKARLPRMYAKAVLDFSDYCRGNVFYFPHPGTGIERK